MKASRVVGGSGRGSALIAWLIVTPVALLTIQRASLASPITFAFAGRVTNIFDRRGLIGDAIHVRDPLTGFYTFDSEAPDLSPATGIARYSLRGFWGAVGVNDFARIDGPEGFIRLEAAWLNQNPMTYAVFTEVEFFGQRARASLELVDLGRMLFPTDALPVVPPPIEYPTVAVFRLAAISEDFTITGDWQSWTLVPEPASGALLALAGLVFIQRRRR